MRQLRPAPRDRPGAAAGWTSSRRTAPWPAAPGRPRTCVQVVGVHEGRLHAEARPAPGRAAAWSGRRGDCWRRCGRPAAPTASSGAVMAAMPEPQTTAQVAGFEGGQLRRPVAGVGMAVAGVDEARLLVVHDAVEGVEVRQGVDGRLVERRHQRRAAGPGHGVGDGRLIGSGVPRGSVQLRPERRRLTPSRIVAREAAADGRISQAELHGRCTRISGSPATWRGRRRRRLAGPGGGAGRGPARPAGCSAVRKCRYQRPPGERAVAVVDEQRARPRHRRRCG